MKKILLAVAGAVSLTLGCAVDATNPASDGDAENASGESAATLASNSTFYTFRQDPRECMFPMCGGYWVKRVNRPTTVCADGSSAAECYVAQIDFGQLTSDEASRAGVLRGTLALKQYGTRSYGNFTTTEAWEAQAKTNPKGTFYRVSDNGIRCFRAPCPSINADKLNYTTTTQLTGLDGTYGSKVAGLLGQEKVITIGTLHSVAGGGRALAVEEVYRRINHDPLACAQDSDCTYTAYNRPVASPADCYCAICAKTLTNVASAEANRVSWEASCANVRLMCPMIMCVMPPKPACVSNKCVAAAPLTP